VSDFINENLQDESIDFNHIVPGLDIDFELHPLKFEGKINSLINHQNKVISDYALQRVVKSKLLDSFEYLPKNTNSMSELLNRVDVKIEKSPGIDKLISISKLKGTDERILAAFLMGKFYEPELFVYIKALMRDLQLPVKIAAIKAATNTKNIEFCPLVIDYLDTPGLISYAYDSLASFGEDALSNIDQYFYKTGISHRILLRLVKLIGQIGGRRKNYYKNTSYY
jgi:hypothetical protein